MEGLMTTLRRTLHRHLQLRRDAKIIVALSGGADSVALLASLLELGYDCEAAHCNFHLRGEESLRDMRFVSELTDRLGVDLHIKDFDVPAAMAATGESIEMACRRLRYEWFDDLLTIIHATDLAVGHHREDNVETFFLNLVRGTGIAGLTGMKFRRGSIVRPLLECSREQIEKYLKDRGLDYVTDSSNLSNEYKRNRLRNTLIPELENLIPGSTSGIEKTMTMLNDALCVYNESVAEAKERYGSPENGKIDLIGLSKEKNARIMLFELLRTEGFTMTQVEDILTDCMRSGVRFTSASGICAELSRGMLEFSACAACDSSVEVYDVDILKDISHPVEISVEINDKVENFIPRTPKDVMFMDYEATRGNARWTLRHWHHGDRMQPYGMKGTKLVSDIFADAKMTAAQKRAAWLLLRNDRIVWVVGVRTSAHFPVTDRTRRYLRLKAFTEQ